MILPASYANGFAPRDGQPLHESLWKSCVLACAPCMGPVGRIVRDWSGNGLNLTHNAGSANLITYSLNQGKYALDCTSGTNADLQPNSSLLDLGGGSWSFGCWARINDTSITTRYLISRTVPGDNDWSILFGYSGATIQFYSRAAEGFGYPASASNITPTQGKWQHIMYTYDGATYRGYLEGREVVSYASATNVAASGGTGFFWGAFTPAGSQWHSAFFDDLRVYRRRLIDAEIRLLASRRGAAYELAPRRRSSVAVAAGGGFKAAWIPRRSLVIGGGTN